MPVHTDVRFSKTTTKNSRGYQKCHISKKTSKYLILLGKSSQSAQKIYFKIFMPRATALEDTNNILEWK